MSRRSLRDHRRAAEAWDWTLATETAARAGKDRSWATWAKPRAKHARKAVQQAKTKGQR